MLSFHVVLNFVPKIEEETKPLYETNTVVNKKMSKKEPKRKITTRKKNMVKKRIYVYVFLHKNNITIDSDWTYGRTKQIV